MMGNWKKTNFGSSSGNQYYSASLNPSFGSNLTKEQLLILISFYNWSVLLFFLFLFFVT